MASGNTTKTMFLLWDGTAGEIVIITISILIIVKLLTGCVQRSTHMVTMRDGIKLATDVYLPSRNPDPHGAILLRTPYNKITGYALGMGAALIAGPMIAGIEGSSIQIDPYLAAGALGLAIFVGIAATIYPALKASKIDPAEALRQI